MNHAEKFKDIVFFLKHTDYSINNDKANLESYAKGLISMEELHQSFEKRYKNKLDSDLFAEWVLSLGYRVGEVIDDSKRI